MNHQLAYEIMCESISMYGQTDPEDCAEIAHAVSNGLEIDWSRYAPSTVEELRPLFDQVATKDGN